MNIRQGLLLEYLLEHPSITTCDKLAKRFECSEKTIRKDIDTLNLFLDHESLKSSIIRKPGSGIFFNISLSETERINWLIASNQLPRNPHLQRLCEELLILTCTPYRYHTISHLSSCLYSNKKQIYADLNEWKTALAQYQITMNIDGHITISGDEELVRWFILSVIHSLPAQNIKTYIEPHLINDKWDGDFYQLCLKETQAFSDIEFTGNGQTQVLVYLKVMMSRIVNHHYVTSRKSAKPLAHQYLKLKNLLEEHFNVEINIAEMHLLQDICMSAAVQWNQDKLEDYVVQEQAAKIVQDIAIKLNDTFDCPVDQKYIQPLNILTDKALTRKACKLAVNNPLEANIKYENMNRICLLSSALLKIDSLNQADLYSSDYTRILLALLEYSDHIDYLAKYKIALVVNYGIDLAMYGKYRIEKATSNIRIASVINENDLCNTRDIRSTLQDIDLLVAFEPLNIDFPCITVSESVTDQDIESIVNALHQWTLGYQSMTSFVRHPLVSSNTYTVLTQIYEDLHKCGSVDFDLDCFLYIFKMLSFVKGKTLIFSYYGTDVLATNMFIYDLETPLHIFGKKCNQVAVLIIAQADKQGITPLTTCFKTILEENCTLVIPPHETELFSNFIE